MDMCMLQKRLTVGYFTAGENNGTY